MCLIFIYNLFQKYSCRFKFNRDEYELDQGTLGRVACMSLVAAVTSGGPLEDETVESFLQEVERVVPDPSYRVRKAASFALGALAKVIPERLVPSLVSGNPLAAAQPLTKI